MAVLITGATGMTAVHVAQACRKADIPFVLASRSYAKQSSSDLPGVNFDWTDQSTYETPFLMQDNINAVYVITPYDNADKHVIEFVDYAIKEHGVKRFVLVGGSTLTLGADARGKVWQHFLNTDVEYCVIRSTWFMDNFFNKNHMHMKTVNSESKFYTATGDTQIAFTCAKDIAAVAFRALTDEKSHDTDYLVSGPELLTNDQIAEKLSSHFGRKVEHVKLSKDDRRQSMVKYGYPENVANFLTDVEVQTSNGKDSELSDIVMRVTGKEPRSFDKYLKELHSSP